MVNPVVLMYKKVLRPFSTSSTETQVRGILGLNHNWDQDAEDDDNANGEDDEEEAPAPAPAAIEDLTAGPMSDKPSTVATDSPSDKRAVEADLTASPVRMVWSQRTSRKRNRPLHPNDEK